jgi:transposase-like protein
VSGTGLSEFFVLAHFLKNMLVAKVKRKNLTAAERVQAVAMLVQAAGEDGRFSHGALKKIREHFGVTRQLIWRLWRRAESARAGGIIEESEFCSRKKLSGRRPMYFKEPMSDAIRNTPLLKR